jgi:hypothetical protein
MTKTALYANPKFANTSGWQDRHNAAMDNPRPGFEYAIVSMLRGWMEYAETTRHEYDSLVGNDGVIGEYWADLGKALYGLLNGSCGSRIDCGTLSSAIHNIMRVNGIREED